MLIDNNRRFVETEFANEQELEDIVVENAEYIFGPSSVYLGKSLIRTGEGTGTIPDGYAFDLAEKQWFIVEAELSRHSVWSHIAPQVAKQLIAAINPTSKLLLTDLVAERVKDDESLQERFEEQGIHTIDVRRFIGEIMASSPIVAIPIDRVKPDLREWAATLKADVKLWEIRKFVEFGNPNNVIFEIPEQFSPQLDTSNPIEESSSIARYDVSIRDLIESNLLSAGDQLTMQYKPKGGQQSSYTATVRGDGSIELLDKVFTSPSYAAVEAIQQAGSNRKTENGWIRWRVADGRLLSDIREEYIERLP